MVEKIREDAAQKRNLILAERQDAFSRAYYRFFGLNVRKASSYSGIVIDVFDDYLTANENDPGKLVSIGEGSHYNTFGVLQEICFVLAQSQHPLVQQFVEDRTIRAHNFPADDFIEQQVLAGMKIMDLGSGTNPTFADIAHKLGAEVYTAGLEVPDSRYSGNEYINAQHTEIDFKEKNATKILLRETSGEFDIVCASFVFPTSGDLFKMVAGLSTSDALEHIASTLLKSGGKYFNVHTDEVFIKR